MAMTDADERFVQGLHGAARAWRAALDRQLKAQGLTAAGWSALEAVADSIEPPSQRELARRLGVDGATLFATIDRLAGRNLVQRTAAEHDRRVKLIVLTGEGGELAARVRREAGALRRLMLERIDARRVAAAAEVLEELRQGLEDA
jgi:MarR family transcriptional regulator for hemolysin